MSQELTAQTQTEHLVIGIEGPAAAGKSTMARTVAQEVGATVVEGGVWYRALTYWAQQEGVGSDDTERLAARAEAMRLSLGALASGETAVEVDGKDVTEQLFDDIVSTAVGSYAQNLELRKVVDKQIVEMVRALPMVITVGRSIQKVLPEAHVLRLTIDPSEADRRHIGRAGIGAQSVHERNAIDAKTAELLGNSGHGDATVDVTYMDQQEQAELLRQFIHQQQVNEHTRAL